MTYKTYVDYQEPFFYTGAWGMDFVSSSSPFSTTPLLFQNFHNHSFFKIFIIIRFSSLTISVDVIHHEYYVYSAPVIFYTTTSPNVIKCIYINLSTHGEILE